jgi:2-polyprenyl-6-methoxyphenol hydroxylase-like FAD-dependent oxidoreductase
MTAPQALTTEHEILDAIKTTCCIVGGGPAGAVLALLLARKGVAVTLLKAHQDFDRDFRGDTIHPSVIEIMAELGLADRLLQLPHSKMPNLTFITPTGTIPGPDFRHLNTRYPYIMMLPQVKFLEFITSEAQRYASFKLMMGANVQELIEKDGVVQGVRYRGQGGWHEVRAYLTVGADGRHSRVRQLAGIEPVGTSPPMDVLWFRLPRKPEEPEGAIARIGHGALMAMLDRGESWQIAYAIPKGSYKELRARGLEALKDSIATVAPELGEPYGKLRRRVDALQEWSQVAFLSVESSRCRRWYRPGLLLLGDAAHAMSPVGGVGINYAIQDAVVAANVLSTPLQQGKVQLRDLAAVQRRREWPTRIIQAFQLLMQERLIARALDPDRPFRLPLFLRLPMVRNLPARLIGLGVWPVHVR